MVAIGIAIALPATEASAEIHDSKRVLEHCMDNADVNEVRNLCYSMKAHKEMTVRLIRKAVQEYGKNATKDDMIALFANHLRVVTSMNKSAKALFTHDRQQRVKQAIFEWHTEVMDEVRGCITKDKTLLTQLYDIHAKASEVVFN